jgi:hypothetical protein
VARQPVSGKHSSQIRGSIMTANLRSTCPQGVPGWTRTKRTDREIKRREATPGDLIVR